MIVQFTTIDSLESYVDLFCNHQGPNRLIPATKWSNWSRRDWGDEGNKNGLMILVVEYQVLFMAEIRLTRSRLVVSSEVGRVFESSAISTVHGLSG